MGCVIFLIAVMWGFPAWRPVKRVWTTPGLSFLSVCSKPTAPTGSIHLHILLQCVDEKPPKKTFMTSQCWYLVKLFKEHDILLLHQWNQHSFCNHYQRKWAEVEVIWKSAFVVLSNNRSSSKNFHIKDFRVDSCNILFQKFPSEKGCTLCPSIHLSIHHSAVCVQPDIHWMKLSHMLLFLQDFQINSAS